MRTLKIFEPAVGCLTGACSPDAQDTAGAFEEQLAALSSRGVEVQRFNLGHDPDEFASQPLVKAAIRQHGMACLPMVLLDGQVLRAGGYPTADELLALFNNHADALPIPEKS